MTITAPTRITIEIHPGSDPGNGNATSSPVVHVQSASSGHSQHTIAEPRSDGPSPVGYEPGECLCLDDDDCAADHAND